MKVVILFGFVCCLSVAFAEINQKCEYTGDCGDDECCLKDTFSQNRCKRAKDKGELCFTKDSIKAQEVYRFMCPCTDFLRCKPISEREGERDQYIGRCV